MINKHLVVTIVVAILSVLVFWTPFKLKVNTFLGIEFSGVGMERIVQNFDGLNFLIVAKTWYDESKISKSYSEVLVHRRPLYFSAHYPGFPALIVVLDNLMTGPNALLGSIIISNLLLAIALYFFLQHYLKDNQVTGLVATALLFFPARMLADRVVGSNEPLFMFFTLTSLLFFEKRIHWLSALAGAGAVLTRSPGIILFVAYFISITSQSISLKQKIKSFFPYLLIPIALLLLWAFYGYRFGSFWAYFQVGGNLNLYWPFAVFASNMDWVSGIWKEDLVYLFVGLIVGNFLTWKKYPKTGVAYFGILYSFFVLCVAHRDLSRYSLPIIPIISLGLVPVNHQKILKYLLLAMMVPIFLYSWQFVIGNYQPISNWAAFL